MEYEKLPVRVLWHRNGIPHIFQYPIRQNSVTGLSLTAREAKKCSLIMFPGVTRNRIFWTRGFPGRIDSLWLKSHKIFPHSPSIPGFAHQAKFLFSFPPPKALLFKNPLVRGEDMCATSKGIVEWNKDIPPVVSRECAGTSVKTVNFSTQPIKFSQLENSDWKLLLVLKRNRRYCRLTLKNCRLSHFQQDTHTNLFLLKSSKAL